MQGTVVLFVIGVGLLWHLAYQDYKEFRVWDVEVGGLFLVSAASWIVRGCDMTTWGLGLLVGGLLVALGHVGSPVPMADVIGMVAVILLSPGALFGAGVMLVMVVSDVMYRVAKNGIKGIYLQVDSPLFFHMFVGMIVMIGAGWWYL